MLYYDFNYVMDDLTELVENEEDLVVTSAIIHLEDEENYDEFYVARVEYDGEVRGIISYDGLEHALERAKNQIYDLLEEEEEDLEEEGDEDWEEEEDCCENAKVSIRHIENFRAVIDELGFDRAVALLERFNK